ncbi:MAG: hypothetical protein ACYCSQ_03555 [bacterium]
MVVFIVIPLAFLSGCGDGSGGSSSPASNTTIAIPPGITTQTYGNANYIFNITGSGSATLTAGNGNDTVNITNDTGDNSITLGSGNDTVNSSTTGNDTIVLGLAGAMSNYTVTEGDGNNSITVTSSGTVIVTAGQGNNTIDLNKTSGTDTISIGQGINTITFGSGANILNLTTVYSFTPASAGTGASGLAGANTLNNYGANSGDTLVFNHSKDSVAPVLLTASLGTEVVTSVAVTITNLQTADSASGDTSVGWTTAGGNTTIIMDHNIGGGAYVDQVIQIVGAASYLSPTTAVSVNSAGLVSVAVN